MTALLIFLSAYLLVMLLVFQQLNIARGQKLHAFVTSTAISVFNFVLLKLVPQPTGIAEIMAFIFGGPLGAVTAMWAYARWSAHREVRT